MFSQMLFHPDHIVPFPQLIAALDKMSCHVVAKSLMKRDAFRVGVGDAGIDIEDVLLF